MADCLFCKIAKKELPATLVFEDDLTLAFLDIKPLFPGHVLLVPKAHHVTLGDLPEELLAPLFSNAKRLAVAVQRGLSAEGTFVAMNNKVSQSVPHLHVHIVPRKKGDGLKGFFWPRNPYQDAAAIARTQALIVAALEA